MLAEHHIRTSGDTLSSVRRAVVVDGIVSKVIGIVAKNNMVLETGHISPAEVLMVLGEGKRQGVRNMLVTHATSQYPGLSIEQLRQATQLGAYLEFVWSGA